jgi:hypothetical protein
VMPRSIARILAIPVLSASALASVLTGVAVAAPTAVSPSGSQSYNASAVSRTAASRWAPSSSPDARQVPGIISSAFAPAGSIPGGQ